MPAAEMIVELKEKCELYKKQHDKIKELYGETVNYNLKLAGDNISLKIILNEIKAKYPDTAEIINQRLEEIEHGNK